MLKTCWKLEQNKKVDVNSATMLLFVSFAVGKAVEIAKKRYNIAIISTVSAVFFSTI